MERNTRTQTTKARKVIEYDHDDDDDMIADDDESVNQQASPSLTDPSAPSPASTNTGTTSSSRRSCKLEIDEETVDKDLLIVSAYIKEDMYYGVKFLYDPSKDLAVGGMIFNHFYKTCRKKLEGVRDYQTIREKEFYLRYVWKTALERSVQQRDLSVKRSSVYTVMQNRFFVSGSTMIVCESVWRSLVYNAW